MSSEKTALGLHKWVGTDSPKREEFNENFGKLESHLADKANQSDLDTTNTNLITGLNLKRDKLTKITNNDLDTSADVNKIKLINLADEVQQALTGNAPALSTIENSSVTTEKYANNSISVDKINFLNKTHNLFNPKTISLGLTIDQTTGDITESDTSSLSDFIEVTPNTIYFVNKTCAIRRYLKDGTYINGTVNLTGSFNSGSTTEKIRLVILNSGLFDFRMMIGDTDLGSVEYGFLPNTENTQVQNQLITNTQNILLNSYKTVKNKPPFTKINLLDNATITNSGCALRNDYNYKWRDRVKSIRVDTVQSTPTVTLTQDSSVDLVGISEFIMFVFVEDVTKVTNLQLGIVGTNWTRSGTNLVNGWNVIRYQASSGDISVWDNASQFRVTIYTTNKTVVYISNLIAIRPDKARILFVNDHGYHRFKELAYPQLKALGIPTTWAINPDRLGYSPIGQSESILSQADIDELANDPYSEFSFHTLDPSVKATEFMTKDELRAETHKAMHYLRKNGIMPRYFWRAAFVGNKAPQHEVIQDIMEAYASPVEGGGIELYPFRNRYNINRVAIHARDNAYFDTTFDTLKKCRPVYVCYTHGLDESGGIHITQAVFDYFLQKVQTGVTEGWLEGTTYSKLRSQYTNVDITFNELIDIL